MHESTFPKESAQSLRGAIQLIIIASHLFFVFPSVIPFTIANKLATSIVALFFFISGFGLSQAYKLSMCTYREHNFLENRILPLIRPMLYLTIIYVLWEYLFHSNDSSTSFNLLDIFRNLILYGDTRLPNSWFVYVLAFLYLAFFVSFRYFRPALAILFILSLISVYGLAYADFPRNWWITNLAFFSGVIYAKYEQQLYKWLSRYEILIGVLLFIGLLLKLNIVMLLPLAYLFIPAIIVVYLHRWGYSNWILDENKGRSLKKGLLFLSSISFELYLIHGFVINILHPLRLSVWGYSFLVLIISVIFSYLYKQLLKVLSSYGL